MDNELETDDFCLDLMYGNRINDENWVETINKIWMQIELFIFLILTVLYYYLVFFKFAIKENETTHTAEFDWFQKE